MQLGAYGDRMGLSVPAAGDSAREDTRIRKDFGLNVVQIVLGHSKAGVTQVYAERDMTRAAGVAQKIGWSRAWSARPAGLLRHPRHFYSAALAVRLRNRRTPSAPL